MQFAYKNIGEEFGKQALLIGLQLNWLEFLALLAMNLILCFGTGIAVGMLTRRVDLGVAVTSGVAAVVACAQTFVFLVYK